MTRIKPRHFIKSCEAMTEVEDGTVSLTVTSPPYWNAIDYDQHVADSSEWFRTRKETPYEEYLVFMDRCFSEVLRATKPGGFCAVIIGTVLLKGAHYPLPQHLIGRMEKLGWEFHQDIVWHKVTGGIKRAGVVIQHPYPGYFRPNIMTEQILIFRRPGGPAIFEAKSSEERESNRIAIDELFKKEIANNVWHIAPVPSRQYPHPCPYPEEIPLRLIMLYSYKGDIVLDPFLGIGSTTKVAYLMGRAGVGYDIKKEYVDFANKRWKEPFSLREKQLVAVFEKTMTPNPLKPVDSPHKNKTKPKGSKKKKGASLIWPLTEGGLRK